jgi:hypothetical protein
VSPITSNLTYAAAIVKQAENCVNCFSLFTQDSVLLKGKLRIIDAKMAKLADAIEAVGVSNTLTNRLAILEQDTPYPCSEMARTRVFDRTARRQPCDHIGGHRGSKGQSAGSLGHCADSPEKDSADVA